MTSNPLSTHYHVGIVVPDIHAARETLARQLDVAWGPIMHLDAVEHRDSNGNDIELPTTMCYSVDAPHLELIQEVPGSIWSCNDQSNLHHIGFWSDDLVADGDRLSAVGCPMQLCGRSAAEAPVTFAYHRNDLGIRIELVDATMREAMSFLFTPGPG